MGNSHWYNSFRGIIFLLSATDCHVGFLEKDPIRGQDSFVTFEEILKQAVKYDVSFLLFVSFTKAFIKNYDLNWRLTICNLQRYFHAFWKYALWKYSVMIYIANPGYDWSNVFPPELQVNPCCLWRSIPAVFIPVARYSFWIMIWVEDKRIKIMIMDLGIISIHIKHVNFAAFLVTMLENSYILATFCILW